MVSCWNWLEHSSTLGSNNSSPIGGTQRSYFQYVIYACTNSTLLVGVVVLSLPEIFKQRSQINEYFPFTGGIGRSVLMWVHLLWLTCACKAWSCSHLNGVSANRITSAYRTPRVGIRYSQGFAWDQINDLPDYYKKLGLKLRTSVQSAEMSTQLDGRIGRQGQPIELAVQQRYCYTWTSILRLSLGFYILLIEWWLLMESPWPTRSVRHLTIHLPLKAN